MNRNRYYAFLFVAISFAFASPSWASVSIKEDKILSFVANSDFSHLGEVDRAFSFDGSRRGTMPTLAVVDGERLYVLFRGLNEVRCFDLKGRYLKTIHWGSNGIPFRVSNMLVSEGNIYLFGHVAINPAHVIRLDPEGKQSEVLLSNSISKLGEYTIDAGNIVSEHLGRISKLHDSTANPIDRTWWNNKIVETRTERKIGKKTSIHPLASRSIRLRNTEVNVENRMDGFEIIEVESKWIDRSGQSYFLLTALDPTKRIGRALGYRYWVTCYSPDGSSMGRAALEDPMVLVPEIRFSDNGVLTQLYPESSDGQKYAVAIWDFGKIE